MDAKSSNLAYDLQKPKPASQIIYEYLLNEIISGRIEEGGRIVESELAKMFGVSRSPVREALKLLEIDGLIEMIPYRGVVATRITEQDVRESLEIKGMVEGFAAGRGALQFGREVIDRLEAILVETEKYNNGRQLQKVLEANIRFHHEMVKSIQNDKLLKYYEALSRSIRRFYSISFAISSGWKFSVMEHRAILSCIKAKDAEGAERAARQHANNTVDRVLALLEKKK